MKGKILNKLLGIKALHALYREDGKWYHNLKNFPGVLFDKNGYIIFKTEQEYKKNPFLIQQNDLHITKGISSLSGYKKFSLEELIKIKTTNIHSNQLDISEKALLNKVSSDLEAYEEENSDNFEGTKKKCLVNYYERKPHLRAEAILIHGTTCLVCNFNFKEHYGVHGEDYIEVHHLVPISKLIDSTRINPKTDMTVLCANCHRMAHRNKNKSLSIQELIEIWNKAQNNRKQ